jgi:hypothetical protein
LIAGALRRGGVKRGNVGGGVKDRGGILRLGVGQHGVIGFDGGTVRLGGAGGEKKELTGGVHVSVTLKR